MLWSEPGRTNAFRRASGEYDGALARRTFSAVELRKNASRVPGLVVRWPGSTILPLNVGCRVRT